MASITEVAIKRPLLITVVFVCLILFGFMSYKTLNYNLLPKFDIPMVMVQTIYPGASSDEVESSITKHIEEAVSSLEGLKAINSSSRESISLVMVELNQDADAHAAQLDAERKISQILSVLPEGINEPVVSRFSLDDLPILRMSATSKLSPTEMYDIVDLKIKPLLTNVPGVAQINLIGGVKREIEVKLDNAKLSAYHVSPLQVQQLIARGGMSFPAGNIQSDKGRYSIRLDAKLNNIDILKDIIIREGKNGSRIYLKDIASITDSEAEPTTINRINGHPGIGIQVLKQTDANTVLVAEGIKKKMNEVKERYKDINFDYEVASDQSVYTLAAADAVMHDLFLAIIIVALVMVFFLHSLRSSLFVLVAIPSAMIPTFVLMWLFGFSLNLMTLMALSLVVGILVDDSIVVLENIYRHMEMGKHKRIAALDGRNEIGFTALSITLVDIVVFIPLALSTGLIGNILREFSLVIVFSTLMSLTVAFTLTPMLASRWGKLEHLTKDTIWGRINLGFESILDGIRDLYVHVLKWTLNHKLITAGIITTLFISTVIVIPMKGLIGATFMQPADRAELTLQIDLSPEYTLSETNQVVNKIEKILLKNPDVVKVFSNVGTQSGEASTNAAANSNLAEINVKLVDKKKRSYSTDEFGQQMRDTLSKYPGIKLVVSPVGLMGNDIPIQVIMKGTEPDSVRKGAQMLFDIIKSTPGTDFVRFSTKSAKKDIAIEIDREKASLYGLSVSEIGGAVQLGFQGNDKTRFKDKGEEYDINIMLDKSDKRSINDIRNLTIQNSAGKIIRLEDVAKVEEVEGQSVRERTDRLSSVKIYGATLNRSLGDIVNDIKAQAAKTKFPEGTEVKYVGAAENMQDSMRSLLMSLGLGILLIYFIMVALYESLLSPFIVLFSIPVSFVGAFLALSMSMNQLSIFAMLGLIMLLGLVAKNAILIVDFANHQMSEGKQVVDALLEAGKERLRPIMMTTLAMVFGMLPIAMATGDGAEVKNGMAWVIIGGLTSSMILTVFLVPGVYYMFHNIKMFFKKKRTN
jgi:HAE1 family hydrophobic/amphiphilic exporter-1